MIKNNPKIKHPNFLLFEIVNEKCMKHVNKLKKKEYKGLTNARGQKSLKIGGRKSQKA